jgi:hypothetical protein
MSAFAALSARHIEVRRGCRKRTTGTPAFMPKMRCTSTPSTRASAGCPKSWQSIETR